MESMCVKIQNELVEYTDGDMSHLQRMQVDAHLQRCKHCARFVHDYRKLGALCRSVVTRSMPEDGAQYLYEFLRQHATK